MLQILFNILCLCCQWCLTQSVPNCEAIRFESVSLLARVYEKMVTFEEIVNVLDSFVNLYFIRTKAKHLRKF